jgi:hypothetical protein
MLKGTLAVTGIVVAVAIAAGIGSKLASGKSDVKITTWSRISPFEIMLKFDMTRPAEEIKDLI